MSLNRNNIHLTLHGQHSNKAWNIITPGLKDYLRGLASGISIIPMDEQYSILQSALRDQHKIAEIAAATGEENIAQLITFPLHRLALFETVAIIETEVRMQSDADLMPIVQDIYRNNVKPHIKALRHLQEHYLTEAKNTALQVSQHEKSNRHTIVLAGAAGTGKSSILETIEEYAQQTLSIARDDIVKISTDAHRNIVGRDGLVGEDKKMGARLTQDESTLISLRAHERMERKIEKGAAPHMLLEGPFPTPQRFKWGTQNNGKLHLFVITTPVKLSIERAYNRGSQTGRYIPTYSILGGHHTIAKDIFVRINAFKNQDIQFSILNTDVPLGEKPITLLSGNTVNRSIHIFDRKKMAEFCGNKNINISAKNPGELFKDTKNKVSEKYLDEINAMDMKIIFSDTLEKIHRIH